MTRDALGEALVQQRIELPEADECHLICGYHWI
jgi:hypothetical protein